MAGANSCKGVILLILLALIVTIHWWHNKHSVVERNAEGGQTNSAHFIPYITKTVLINGVSYLQCYYLGNKIDESKSHIGINVIISVKANQRERSDLQKCSGDHFSQILECLEQSVSADMFLNNVSSLINSSDFSGFAVNIKVVDNDGREISQIKNALEKNLHINPRQ